MPKKSCFARLFLVLLGHLDKKAILCYTYDDLNRVTDMFLMKPTNGAVTKYVYGRGLIGEETNNSFKTYHFDCRGSTIAITDASGTITDTFAYDTYGKLICRTGVSKVIFCYNGRDGVVTDENGLVYMRARYYSPDMRRFINADIVAGAISNAVTLNRFAYANGNPVSFVDPFGLSADDKDSSSSKSFREKLFDFLDEGLDAVGLNVSSQESLSGLLDILERGTNAIIELDSINIALRNLQKLRYLWRKNSIDNKVKPKRRDPGSWILENRKKLGKLDDWVESTSKTSKLFDEITSLSKVTKYLDNITPGVLDTFMVVVDVAFSVGSDFIKGEKLDRIATDAMVVVTFDWIGILLSEGVELGVTAGVTALCARFLMPAGAMGGATAGPAGAAAGGTGGALTSVAIGETAGEVAGFAVGAAYDIFTGTIKYEGKTLVEWAQDEAYDCYLWWRDNLST